MRVTRLVSLSIGAATAVLLSTSASAGIIQTSIGGDPTATSRAEAKNAVAAETNFLSCSRNFPKALKAGGIFAWRLRHDDRRRDPNQSTLSQGAGV